MISLGIHIGHDGGCAVAKDGFILCAIAEERLVRHKYHNGWWHSLKYCLESTELTPSEIDIIIISNAGQEVNLNLFTSLFNWGFSQKRTKIISCDHHLSHAIGALSLSNFTEGLVFVGDAGGNNFDTESAYIFNRNSIDKVYGNLNRPNYKGLGSTYEAFTNLLGFSDQESGKVMALAAYGNESAFDKDLFQVSDNGIISSQLLDFHAWGALTYLKTHGFSVDFNQLSNSMSADAQNIAAFIQKSFEKTLSRVLKILLKEFSADNLVLAGGIALNCSANGKIRKLGISNQLFVSPVASDIGLPIGNAIYGFYKTSGNLVHQIDRSISYGHNYSENDIQNALTRNPDLVQPGGRRKYDHEFYKSVNITREVAEMIDNGDIIGWFQGKSESGPRALGSRSILAKVSGSNLSKKINEVIKRREWFRPFGPSILDEDLSGIGLNPGFPSYMTEAVKINPELGEKINNCTHVDSTARIHSVSNHSNLIYRKLLEELRKKQSYGAVLNTSFNINEPIVETPSDALATFVRSEIDYLALGDYIIKKIK